MSVDPLADKYPSLSAFAMVANNPVMLIDPNGMEIEEGSKEEFKKQKGFVIGARNMLNDQISNLSGKKQTDARVAKINSLEKRRDRLDEVVQTMSDLGDSDQMYRLSETDGAMGSVSLDSDEVINITFNKSSTANFVHEITHAGQFENGEIAFSSESGQGFMDVYDEISAYQNQAAFNPGSLPNGTGKKLTPSWIMSIPDPNSKFGLSLYGDHSLTKYGVSDPIPISGFSGKSLKETQNVYFKKGL